jgi:NADH-quinone oxidoreductase subunit N
MLILTLIVLLIRRLFITRIIILIYLFTSLLLYNGYFHNHEIILYNNLWIISYKKGIIGICILLIASFILKQDRYIKGEKSLILSLSIIGILSIISSNDWILFLLSLELLTYSTSIIACMDKKWESTRSAGLKYFLIGAFSSGFILLGITLLYSKTGLLQIMMIEDMRTIYNEYENHTLSLIEYSSSNHVWYFLNGWNLILAGLLFKIGAAPFHYW